MANSCAAVHWCLSGNTGVGYRERLAFQFTTAGPDQGIAPGRPVWVVGGLRSEGEPHGRAQEPGILALEDFAVIDVLDVVAGRVEVADGIEVVLDARLFLAV